MTLKEKFKKAFSYTWYLYLIAIVVPCVGFPLAFSYLHRPGENEKLSLFLSSDVNTTELENTLLNEFKTDGVKNVDVYSQNSNGNELMYLQKLNVVGLNSCDIIVIPESRLGVFDPVIYSVEINQTIKDYCKIESELFYTSAGKEYAVELPSSTPLKTYSSFQDNTKYYAFFGANSFNVGEFSSKPKTSTNAFKLMKYILDK